MAKKRFGQNFLHDANIIHKIVSVINPKPGQHIVEIGPGKGALTKHILPLAKKLDVIEIDRDLILPLEKECQSLGELHIHQADALDFDFSIFSKGSEKIRIIGNLPYNISTPLLFHLITFNTIIDDMHFMLQKEVVNRICAKPGNKIYGRLSVMIQYHCETERLFDVPPSCFYPIPKVDSAIIRLKPNETLPLDQIQYKQFSAIVKKAFGHRRKTLANSLKDIISSEQWNKLGIDRTLRPEQLSVTDFIQLAKTKTP